MPLTNEITMTSTEIAELTGKEKKHIHEAIKEQLLRQLYGIEDGRTLDHQQIQGLIIEYDERGYWKQVHLDRYHTDILITGYEIKYRAAVIKRMHELEALLNKPMTRLERLKAEVEAEEQRLVMLEQVKQQAKVIASKRVLTDDGEEYFTVQRMRVINPNTRPSGKLLRRISEAQNYTVFTVYSHYSNTEVQTYHKDIWELCYPDIEFD